VQAARVAAASSGHADAGRIRDARVRPG